MPFIDESGYEPPLIFRNAHLNTLYAALGRKVKGVTFRRERLSTPDGDFIDLDWSEVGSSRLLILLHGLEGNSCRPYILGMTRVFNAQGWDVAALNFRGCSGEPNLLPRSYHIGDTADLRQVVHHVLNRGVHRQVALSGFSLGGNVILKFLGEDPDAVPREICAAAVFSVPCDIATANVEIDKWKNRLYRWRFMRSLNAKMRRKAELWPDLVKMPPAKPSHFRDFDNYFTAPLHGFADAHDYWTRCGSIRFIPHIRVPALMVNAQDDTFLSPACYPVGIAEKHPLFYLETPAYGGHVGFVTSSQDGVYWSERRAWKFISAQASDNGVEHRQ